MKIRSLSLALIQNKRRIFVMECFDKIKNEEFYRPLGGGIEFGELGYIALEREFQEEMNAGLVNIEYVTTFENIFTCEGVAGHEIVLLFSAEFSDKTLYSMDEIMCIEGEVPFKSKWIEVKDFLNNKRILYPDGLSEYLEE
ncbi:MAG: NUDIX domain-containing protein [Oceanospirillaceae bacterium]|nr:NUDIX domain-containing protein [Oceanospirillaceae bacterium]